MPVNPARRRKLSNPERVAAAGTVVGMVAPPDGFLRRICEHCVETVPQSNAAAVTWVQHNALVGAVAGEHVRSYEGTWVDLPSSMCVAVVSVDAPLYAPDVDKQPLLSECLVRDKFPGYCGHPIHFRGHVVGALALLGERDALPVTAMTVLAAGVAEIEVYMAAIDAG